MRKQGKVASSVILVASENPRSLDQMFHVGLMRSLGDEDNEDAGARDAASVP